MPTVEIIRIHLLSEFELSRTRIASSTCTIDKAKPQKAKPTFLTQQAKPKCSNSNFHIQKAKPKFPNSKSQTQQAKPTTARRLAARAPVAARRRTPHASIIVGTPHASIAGFARVGLPLWVWPCLGLCFCVSLGSRVKVQEFEFKFEV